MNHLSHASADGIDVIQIRATKLLDPLRIQEVGDELIELLEGLDGNDVLLDLSRVTAISSEMFGKLMRARNKCKSEGRRFRLCGIASDLLKIFQTLNLDSYFEISREPMRSIASFESTSV